MKEAFAFAIGLLTGARSMTGPMLVTRAATSGKLEISSTPLSWLGTETAAKTFATLAAAEYVADKLPFVPSRVTIGPLGGRLAFGALCGAAVELAADRQWHTGAALGMFGALIGAFAGYGYRTRIAEGELPDFPFALLEDAVVLGSAYLLFHSSPLRNPALSPKEEEGLLEQEARYGAVD